MGLLLAIGKYETIKLYQQSRAIFSREWKS